MAQLADRNGTTPTHDQRVRLVVRRDKLTHIAREASNNITAYATSGHAAHIALMGRSTQGRSGAQNPARMTEHLRTLARSSRRTRSVLAASQGASFSDPG
jgi:hypothetical protein